MKATIKQDSCGCLHIWEGEQIPTGYRMTWKADGQWADLFIQSESDIQAFKADLAEEDRDMIESGYSVITEISDDYGLIMGDE